jgi:hypothetical protein
MKKSGSSNSAEHWQPPPSLLTPVAGAAVDRKKTPGAVRMLWTRAVSRLEPLIENRQ